jgi:hypothetical protein
MSQTKHTHTPNAMTATWIERKNLDVGQIATVRDAAIAITISQQKVIKVTKTQITLEDRTRWMIVSGKQVGYQFNKIADFNLQEETESLGSLEQEALEQTPSLEPANNIVKFPRVNLLRLLLDASLVKVLCSNVAFQIDWYHYDLSNSLGHFIDFDSAWKNLLLRLRGQLTNFEFNFYYVFFRAQYVDFYQPKNKSERLEILAEFEKLNKCFEPVSYPSPARVTAMDLGKIAFLESWLGDLSKTLKEKFYCNDLTSEACLNIRKWQSAIREVIVSRAMALG